MRFVIHKDWGSYLIPRIVRERFDQNNILYKSEYDDSFNIRTNAIFIQYVEESWSSEYKVVNIPDNYTDYKVIDYDGVETLIYIVDGKIYEA